ncbi:hypothetical protein HJC23_000895 [Cyclotella cryptica]|uniref:Circumsporozoite protein n=1 Tax=Cyclotella cryptica TaxID=29204 RepID=A0ABD3PTC3_9STRA|eukprot:CCRYP_011623-RA/>CCRYP_011623-RA protein AED:0.47 eAED:0.29 QI:0/0/0/1/1/1/3/0/1413
MISVAPTVTCRSSTPNAVHPQNHLRSRRSIYDTGSNGNSSERRLPSYPYIPSWSADTCTATRKAESWEASSSTLSDCCTKSFGWQVDDCIAKGLQLEAKQQDASTTDYKYIPDWGARTCYNDAPPPNDWVDQYKTLQECCKANFEWVLQDCLGDQATDDDDATSQTYWYPQWSTTKCLVHTKENPAPDYMARDPQNEMWTSFKECCQDNFPTEIKQCKLDSRLDDPTAPTRPPATDTTLVIIPINYSTYYYPRYTQNKCLYNGDEAPGYMTADPVTYFSLTAKECCEIQFPLNVEDCLRNSNALPDDGSGGTFNEERWKDHYYPVFSKVGCINDNAFADYMKESPATFFFTTIPLCCSSENFDKTDYQTCLKNSVDVTPQDDDGTDDTSQGVDGPEKRGPILILYFGGRLYFQNVFIPSSNRVNMIVVKNAILSAVESTFQGGSTQVDVMYGKNFDGIDLTGLRRLGETQEEEEPQESPGNAIRLQWSQEREQHQRELGRMQLFSFVIEISIDCSATCIQDGKTYGRQVSLELGEVFDDAIRDGSMFKSLKTYMEDKGLIGPFYSASLDDGALLYEKAELDMNGVTPSPTSHPTKVPTQPPSGFPSLEPTPLFSTAPSVSPSEVPSVEPTTSPTLGPTLSLSPTIHVVRKFYPDYVLGTCVSDNRHSEFEINFYDTLEECCKFPWLIEKKCLRIGSKSPTNRPTGKPSKAPSAHPTNRPSKPPSTSPTKRPITFSPTGKPSSTSSPTIPPSKTPSTTPTTKPVTLSPTSNPITSSPSKIPTSLPTQKPTSLSPTRRPTPGPTIPPEPCENKWHVSIEPGELQTCTNSLNYPAAWDSNPTLKSKMLLDTSKQCCDNNFSGKECKLTNVCGGGSAAGSCSSRWHLAIERGGACTNNDNYRPEWPESMFYDTGEECCQKNFGGACAMLDDCPETPETTTSSTTMLVSCTNSWHISTLGAANTCTNDKAYPAAWDNENIRPYQLFDNPGACCDKFFKGKECNLVNICAVVTTSTTTTQATASGTQVNGDCSNPWHISTVGAANTCTNDNTYPSTWNNPLIRDTQFHPTAEACCDKAFGNGVCNLVDVCTDTFSSNGYYPVIKWPGCTNDNSFPEYMKGSSDFFFGSIEACCSSSNFVVTDYDVCLEKSVDASSPTTPATTGTSGKPTPNPTPAPTHSDVPSGDCSNPWHVSVVGATNTCTNDKTYPSAWNDESIRDSQLFVTAEACCEKFFKGQECNKVNVCPPSTTGTSSTIPNQSTTTTATTAATTTTTTTSTAASQKQSLFLDWESNLIDETKVRFEGLGKWKIDDTQPCCKTGVSIHNPLLLPGEYSSMVIDFTIPSSGGKISFNYNMGLGKFTFLIDGDSKVTVAVPGGGSKKFEGSVEPGDHTFTWKFEPPSNPNMPLSYVWIDNISIESN